MKDDPVISKDHGCHTHPSCLNCPESVCLEEVPKPRINKPKQETVESAKALRKQGKSYREISCILDLNIRTVCRYCNER